MRGSGVRNPSCGTIYLTEHIEIIVTLKHKPVRSFSFGHPQGTPRNSLEGGFFYVWLDSSRLISCDEAGFTGNRLLDREQPYFAYASVDLSTDEAVALIGDARRRMHRLQMPELKASKLLKTEAGRALILEVLQAIEGRYISTLYDKRLSLAANFFEYIYEPVLQKNNILFYRHNLHKFVATFLYMQMISSGEGAEDIAVEFERFMRSLDPADAPALFSRADARLSASY